MSSSSRRVFIAIAIISSVVFALLWFRGRPHLFIESLQIVALLAMFFAFALVIWEKVRSDSAPDYLGRIAGRAFSRGGLCFVFRSSIRDGLLYLDTYIQNQFERACSGRIVLSSKPLTIRNDFDCPPGGLCVKTVCVQFPAQLKGQRLSFDVGATVVYPQGRGRRLRFAEGVLVGAERDSEKAAKTSAHILDLLYLLLGLLAVPFGHTFPQTGGRVCIQLSMPQDVAAELPVAANSEFTVLWKLGDPPLAEFVFPGEGSYISPD